MSTDLRNLSLDETVERLRAASGQYACLRLAYAVLCRRYYGDRFRTVTRFWRIFDARPERVWRRRGFLHCVIFNRMLRYLLVRSGHFVESDVRFHWTLLRGVSPHEYARVRVGNERVAVDCWSARYGVPFGRYAGAFGTYE